jgi:hypothetical protein
MPSSAHQEATIMADETVRATMVINAPAKAIFAVLADLIKHAAIDGTGWVREPLDSQPLTAAGQVFRMAMYHANHPDGNYQMANLSYDWSAVPGQHTGFPPFPVFRAARGSRPGTTILRRH